MSDAGMSQKAADCDLDLTRTIKKLSVPVSVANGELCEE